MKVSLRFHKSSLTFDLKNGGKLTGLTLCSGYHPFGRELIRGETENFFLSGSYFLFPWVNRIKTQEFTFQNKKYLYTGKIWDESGLPIHGLVFDTERKILRKNEGMEFSEILLGPTHSIRDCPEFIEKYQLFQEKLILTVSFTNTTHSTQFFSFGYHPYFDLGVRIDSLQLSSNLWDLIPLSKEKIPKGYSIPGGRKYLFQNDEKISNLELDHCITGITNNLNPGVSLTRSETGETVTISTTHSDGMIPQNYFQLYTPPDRKTIAIEPMSSSGDVFQSGVSFPTKLFPGETKKAQFQIHYL